MMSRLSSNYLMFTFLIMLSTWGVCVVLSINDITVETYYLLYALLFMGGMSPAIASYFSLKKEGNIKSFKDWIKNVFDFKHNIMSYLLVVLFCLIYFLPRSILAGYNDDIPVYAIFAIMPVMLFGGGLEETGWRYILQPELEKIFNFTFATIIVGLIWWLWHLPLFFIQGVGQYGSNYFTYGLFTLGLSFALACIRKNTHSVWLCVLFHIMANTLGMYIAESSLKANIISTSLLIITSYILIEAQKKKIIFK